MSKTMPTLSVTNRANTSLTLVGNEAGSPGAWGRSHT
jgi:hypothetical protein